MTDAWLLRVSRFPVEDFDTENPAAADLPPVGDYLALGQSAAEDALESIRNLSPSADVQADVDALARRLSGSSRA